NYNAQMVKEFYANLTNPSQKKKEVVVRGKWVLYSEANINRYYGLTVEDEEDEYQATLNSLSEASLTEIMEGMTEERTKWNYRKGVNEWSIKRMSLKPVMRVQYCWCF
ncbi:hypothetical protein A2U01_0060481, partial [Trifolium medium]|nr:hypothetical protein [Trifolium medium]